MMVGRDYHRAAGRNACNIGRLYAQILFPGRGVRWNISIIGKQRRGFRALLFAPEMVELHVIGLAERLCSTMKKRLRGDKYSLGEDHASNLVTQENQRQTSAQKVAGVAMLLNHCGIWSAEPSPPGLRSCLSKAM